MKTTIPALLALLLISSVTVSCQTGLTSDKVSLTETIAHDPRYHDYQRSLDELRYLVATKAFDMQAIDQLATRYPQMDIAVCGVDPAAYDEVKGGRLYYHAACREEKASAALHEAFGYFGLSQAQRREINRIYLAGPGKDSQQSLLNRIKEDTGVFRK